MYVEHAVLFKPHVIGLLLLLTGLDFGKLIGSIRFMKIVRIK